MNAHQALIDAALDSDPTQHAYMVVDLLEALASRVIEDGEGVHGEPLRSVKTAIRHWQRGARLAQDGAPREHVEQAFTNTLAILRDANLRSEVAEQAGTDVGQNVRAIQTVPGKAVRRVRSTAPLARAS
jgi:hypothetical protein